MTSKSTNVPRVFCQCELYFSTIDHEVEWGCARLCLILYQMCSSVIFELNFLMVSVFRVYHLIIAAKLDGSLLLICFGDPSVPARIYQRELLLYAIHF